MKIVRQYDCLNKNIHRGVALGNFDGVHIGHQKLIKTLVQKCKLNNFQSCIYTFTDHTLKIIENKGAPPQITNINKKQKIFKSLGVDILYLEQFNNDIMALTPEEFVKNILIDKLNCKIVVVGFDYSFGYKGIGKADTLKELGKKYGFKVYIINPITINNNIVSSSIIRQYVKNGNIEDANVFLGRPYSIYGKVIHGKGIGGNKLSYPTANILIEPSHLVPKEGVYATYVKIDGLLYKGATFVGNSPTIGEYSTSIETFIINFNKNIYGKYIELQFIKKLRGQIKFDSINKLKNQMCKDVKKVNTYLQL